ncbi:RDD family protein [Agromyces sp. SYSU T00194]|uniref:RDD family protein n=1 Tax=Agromyces chitinivorans TaxID=3158560 RepID=UPI00339A2A3C
MSVTPGTDAADLPGARGAGIADPAEADVLGVRSAPTGRRALAFVIDAAIWSVLVAPGAVGAVLLLRVALPAALGEASVVDPADLALPLVLVLVSQVLLSAFGLVQLILHGRRGITVGKASTGLRSVSMVTFGRPGFWRITWRAAVLWLSWSFLPVFGPALLFASGLWDASGRGRSWLDRLGSVWLVDARHGLDPSDATAIRKARRALAPAPSTRRESLPSLATDASGTPSFVPQARSASGVVAAPAVDETWVPPELGSTPPTLGATTTEAGTAPPAVVLVLDDGTRVDVTGDGLLGRAPEPRGGERIAQLLPLDDARMEISKTHAAFGIDDAGFWIADRGSTNGTAVRQPGRDAVALVAGERTALAWGARVEVGGRAFTVERAEVGA